MTSPLHDQPLLPHLIIRSLEAHGVPEKVVQKLVEAGVHGLAHLAEMSDEDLGGLDDVGPKTVEKVREAAALAQKEWDERDAALEAERVAAEQAAAEQAAQEAQDAMDASAAESGETAGEPAQADAAETAEAAAAGGAKEDGADGQR